MVNTEQQIDRRTVVVGRQCAPARALCSSRGRAYRRVHVVYPVCERERQFIITVHSISTQTLTYSELQQW